MWMISPYFRLRHNPRCTPTRLGHREASQPPIRLAAMLSCLSRACFIRSAFRLKSPRIVRTYSRQPTKTGSHFKSSLSFLQYSSGLRSVRCVRANVRARQPAEVNAIW